MPDSRRVRAFLLLLVPGTMWGMTFPITKIVLRGFEPLTITAVRGLLVCVPLIWYWRRRGGRLAWTWTAWRPFVILGVLNNGIPFLLVSWGQQYIPAGLATILVSLMPLFTAIIAHFAIDDDRLTRRRVGGIVVALLGVLVLVGPSALAGITINLWAQIVVIIASVSYAAGSVYARLHLRRSAASGLDTSIQIVGLQYLVSSGALLPVALLVDQPWATPFRLDASIALGLLVVSTILSVVLYYVLIDRLGVGTASSTVYLIPPNGVIWSAVILGEPIEPQTVTALALILTGVALVNGVRWPRRWRLARWR